MWQWFPWFNIDDNDDASLISTSTSEFFMSDFDLEDAEFIENESDSECSTYHKNVLLNRDQLEQILKKRC